MFSLALVIAWFGVDTRKNISCWATQILTKSGNQRGRKISIKLNKQWNEPKLLRVVRKTCNFIVLPRCCYYLGVAPCLRPSPFQFTFHFHSEAAQSLSSPSRTLLLCKLMPPAHTYTIKERMCFLPPAHFPSVTVTKIDVWLLLSYNYFIASNSHTRRRARIAQTDDWLSAARKAKCKTDYRTKWRFYLVMSPSIF